MNFEFSTKFGGGHPYQHVPEKYKAYCSIEPEKRAYKVWISKNVLLRKSGLKFLEDIKTKKIHISTLSKPIWMKFDWDVWSIHVLILQSSSKCVEQSANFEKCTFEKITFKVFGGHKDAKNSILALPTPIWLKFGCEMKYVYVLILQSSSKYTEQSTMFHSSIWRLQHFKNILCEFLTQFDWVQGRC